MLPSTKKKEGGNKVPNWTKEQEEAIYRKGQNIIVSAGAGSGKTAVLTERVIEKVKSGISLSHLLILTFTNLAAREMHDRIGDKLKENGILDELSKLDTADITTFDAYALSLVKKYHYLLDVRKDITIIDSALITIYKEKTLRSIFDDFYERQDEEFLSLIGTYDIKDDSDIFNYILLLDQKFNLKPSKREYLENYFDNHLTDELIIKDKDEYLSLLMSLTANIQNYLDYIDDDAYLDKLNASLKPLLDSSSYDELKSALDIKLPIARGVSDITKEYKEKIVSTIGEIKKYTIYPSEEDITKGILLTKPFMQKIIDILLLLDEKVSKYKAKYDAYEYHDIANLAIKLVKEHSDIREEIKSNLDEILIDEYQDTSDIQEEFISYIASNNVYMVGDIKQSIYRFRNANPYIFKNKYDAYSQNNGGIKIDLNKNFRSREEVIANINLFFNHIMDDELGGASYTSTHQMIFGNNTYNEEKNNLVNDFEVYTYTDDSNFKKEEIEAFIIGKDILSKIENKYLVLDKETKKNRPVRYSDFAILMDNRKHFDLYKKILEYLKIPTLPIKSDNLTDSEVIIIIKNIISFILKIKTNTIDTEFKRLFTSLNRSFLINLPDNEIFNYFLNNNYEESNLYTISMEIASQIDMLSLSEIIDLILEKYDFANKLFLIGDYNLNTLRIDKLKEIIQNLTRLDYTIYDFQEYLTTILNENLKIEYNINEENDDAVKIMTIHASKGLEFAICYYSGLTNKFNIREATDKFSYDEKYGIIMPYRQDFIYNTIYHNLSYKNYIQENIGEKIRLFYVALTRAKEKMIFILPNSKKENDKVIPDILSIDIRKKYNSFASIMYSLEPILKKYYKSIDIEDLNLTKDYNKIKGTNYEKVLKPSSEKIIVEELKLNNTIQEEKTFSKNNFHLTSPEEENKLKFGVRMHELFELTDFLNPDYTNLSSYESKVIHNLLQQIDMQNCNIYKEYEFAYVEDNTTYHGIIDLMIEYPDYIKIIDYKLKNIDDDAYEKQLKGYQKYVANTFKKKTDVYLYSIIDNNLKKL